MRQCKSSSASHSTTLEIQTISEFLLRTQALVDALTEIGVVSSKEQLHIILQGLPQEYKSTVSLISSRFDPLSIDEVETLLFTHEVQLEKFKKAINTIFTFSLSM